MIEKRLVPFLLLFSLTLVAQPLLFGQSEEAQNGGRWQARFKGTFDGCDLNMETRVSPAVVKELESMGHVIKLVGQYCGGMGGGQAVMSVTGGVHFGASAPRKDGAAVPENPPFK